MSGKRKSVMKHSFSQVPSVSIPRSTFKRDHGYKTTFDAGYLVPFYADEVLPGDTFNLNATLFARMPSALQVPLMDNMKLETFFFFVPNRLLWNNFQKFMGEQDNPEDSTDYLVPVLDDWIAGFAPQSLHDYLGLPTQNDSVDTAGIAALHHRAYNLIWNEWFRDQNLQDSVPVNKGDGPDDPEDYVLLRRGKRHDYFTSCLPWPQKGPGVELPLGDIAPVTGSIVDATAGGSANGMVVNILEGTRHLLNVGAGSENSPVTFEIGEDTNNNLNVDLSAATAVTINTMRQAFQLQRLLERDARGGTRYTEIIRSHFGTVSPDSRLQRPEYLGGGSVPINIQTVPQTSATDDTSPQGHLSAFAVTGSGQNGFSKSFTEHGVLLGLVNVRADLTYQRGLPRMFSRRTKYDFYWPALAHLGEQAVLNKEIFYDMANGLEQNEEVFGYQERWAEYRYFPSKITGKLRSSDDQSLDVYHLSQNFTSLPVLSSAFIQDTPPLDRIAAIPDEPHFVLDAYIKLRTARPIPVYSVPGMIDHL